VFKRALSALARRREGSVSVITALTLPILIAVTGLALEYGNGLDHKVEDQRVADAAAFAAATAYNANSSNSLTSVADAVAAMNGLSASNIAASLVTSPSGDGNKAVEVTVTTQVPLLLSGVLGNTHTDLSVTATSYAEMKTAAAGCIIALNAAGTGVTVTSSAGITADACAVESNATVTAVSSSHITTIQVDYNSSTPPTATSSSTIAAPSGKTLTETKEAVTDPFAGNSEVATATARLSSVEALTSPAAPSVPTGSNLSYSASTFTGALPAGCSQTHSGSTWTVTCAGAGPYDMGSLTISSAHVAFNTGGSASATYNFNGGVTVSSSAGLTAGPGTFDIAQGITIASSSSATFGAGTFDIGPSASACTDGGKYSLCVESSTSLTLGGPSAFTFGGGIYAGSSATIELGSGTTNTYDIGSSSNGNGAVAASSSNLLFSDATSGSNTFDLVGNITSASSACVALPDAPEHDINGSIIANSSSDTTLGSGIYTVSDYVDDESSSGGSGCSGWSGGTAGTGVTLVLGALATPASGSCSGMAVCVLSSSSQALVAPTTGPTTGFAIIGPTSSSNTAGALFGSSSSGTYSGVVYMPNGPISIASSSSVGGGSSACLELIGSQISLTSSSGTGSTCSGTGQSTPAGVVLVE
jgi:hypothetical protein